MNTKKNYSKGLRYCLAGDHYLVKGIGRCKDTDIVIPEKVKGKPVYGIMRCAFRFNKDIKSVTIPTSVKFIGDHSFFACSNLLRANIPIDFLFYGIIERNAFMCGSKFCIVLKNN